MTDLTLFYSPAAYCSHKVLLALFEKNAIFQKHIIRIHSEHGDQNEPWYMRMNPKGVVPVLKDGDKIICESDVIIDYVDRNVPGDPTLVVDKTKPEGQITEKVLEILNNVPYPMLTFGTLLNPEFSGSGIRMPGVTVKGIKQRMVTQMAYMKTMVGENPDLKEAYQARVERKSASGRLNDPEKMKQAVAHTEKAFDELESVLRKNKEDGNDTYWLVGPTFTKADIVFTTLLTRLYDVGQEGRFFPQDKRPNVYDYYQRLQKRRSVQMLRAEIDANADPF